MFVGARTEVYNGMIFGEHSKDTDLDCNPCNAKHVSNVRTAGKDEFIQVRRGSSHEVLQAGDMQASKGACVQGGLVREALTVPGLRAAQAAAQIQPRGGHGIYSGGRNA